MNLNFAYSPLIRFARAMRRVVDPIGYHRNETLRAFQRELGVLTGRFHDIIDVLEGRITGTSERQAITATQRVRDIKPVL